MKGKIKKIFCAILSMLILLSNVSISYASEAYSPYKTFPTTNGYTYKARASVNTDGTAAWSFTDLNTADWSNAPAGYMGARARVFDSSGNVKKSSAMLYSSEASSFVSIGTGRYSVQGGTFYGKGEVHLYNGDGYTPYDTYQSPNQNNSSSSMLVQIDKLPDYQINDKGQVYGSAMLALTKGYEPDLISAIGLDGTKGYVYSTDLNGEVPSTPEEAIKLTAQRVNNWEIPLYESDGETVIGSFKIETVLRDIIPE